MSVEASLTFSSLGLAPNLVDALPSQCKTPTSIQSLAIPAVSSKKDVLALAQTGSGKTFAFGLPLLSMFAQSNQKDNAIILVPTRELASQVTAALSEIATSVGIGTIMLCGGVDKSAQVEALSSNPDIIVATPGRLLDLINEGAINLTKVRHLVLDEADRLLDMGFWPDIQKIMLALPSERQTLMFSATLPEELSSLVSETLREPVTIKANVVNSVAESIEERLYLVNKGSKANVLIDQINEHKWSQVLVFIGARDNADALCKKLNKAGITTSALHGDKSQAEREQALDAFKNKQTQVLVATDLLARGIHIDHLPVVINVELPSNPAVYVHRVGRTARANQDGLAISLVSHGESEYLQAIRALTNRALPLAELEKFPVTDKPSSGESKRAPRDKKANRRTAQKKSVKQFQGKGKPKRT
ncbi:DEAD/DEAH box helicase [Enterovibrio sp. ZSDZ35]|uniref:DEAD/DEAH box helicase n=1 Tax=Enterovibrio qingdaonensis TaxID=2899818 RepID=A0ABT5QNU3_9GAMM|nr:DEAD/DEAH box helicase [Enterovibrio sp. ZSDZ35]MDD1782661.1 DEAD/DEAH box helicase [Enterovibrio sp. ZSDZ35]